MTIPFMPASMRARNSLAALAAAVVLLHAPAPAAAWQRVARLGDLCAEAGGRPVTRPAVVRGRAGDASAEALPAPCTVDIRAGAVLRVMDLSAEAAGGRIVFALSNGGSLELHGSTIIGRSVVIQGRSGGAVRLGGGTTVSGTDGAGISTMGDVTIRASGVTAGGGQSSVSVVSSAGTVDVLDSAIGARYGADLAGAQGVRIIGAELLGGGLATSSRGDVIVVDTEGYGLTAFSRNPAERALVVIDNETVHSIALDDRSGLPATPYRTCVSVGNVPEAICP